MSRRKSPSDGTAFLVPLRDGGYAVGVLARANGKGSAFGYFFGPRVSKAAEVDFARLRPGDALLTGMFGDLELLRGNWPAVGVIEGWTPERWPVQPLARVDEASGRAWVTSYNDALQPIAEREINRSEASRYSYDRMMGAGAVEIRLTKLLAGSHSENS